MKLARRTATGIACIAAILASACTQPRIEGTVQAPSGVGLRGVAIAIENSGFSTTSDANGRYSVEFAPGSFAVTFSKAGFASSRLDLTLSEESVYPAQPVVLLPYLEESGVYYLSGNEFKALPAGQIKWNDTMMTNVVYRRHSAFGEVPPPLPAGDIVFANRHKPALELARLGEENLINAVNIRGIPFDTVYDKIVEVKSEIVGDQQLLIHRVNLDPGRYAWVESSGESGGYGRFGKLCFIFDVAG